MPTFFKPRAEMSQTWFQAGANHIHLIHIASMAKYIINNDFISLSYSSCKKKKQTIYKWRFYNDGRRARLTISKQERADRANVHGESCLVSSIYLFRRLFATSRAFATAVCNGSSTYRSFNQKIQVSHDYIQESLRDFYLFSSIHITPVTIHCDKHFIVLFLLPLESLHHSSILVGTVWIVRGPKVTKDFIGCWMVTLDR